MLSDAIAQVPLVVVSPIDILNEVVATRFLGFTRLEQVIVNGVPICEYGPLRNTFVSKKLRGVVDVGVIVIKVLYPFTSDVHAI